jgi:alpha-N-arabinofuranosidase
MMSSRRAGTSLRTLVDGPAYSSPSHGMATHVDASAILDDDRLHVFLTNRDDQEAEVRLCAADRDIAGIADAEILTGPDPKAGNDWDAPEAVRAEPFGEFTLGGGSVTLRLPAMSFAASTFRLA